VATRNDNLDQAHAAASKILSAVAPATNYYERRVLLRRAAAEVRMAFGGDILQAGLMLIMRPHADRSPHTPAEDGIAEIVIKDVLALRRPT
jgi:hypothetical protein